MSNVIKLRKAGSHRGVGSSFFVTISGIILDKWRNYITRRYINEGNNFVREEKLAACIPQLKEVSWMFSKKPGVYFTRDRK